MANDVEHFVICSFVCISSLMSFLLKLFAYLKTYFLRHMYPSVHCSTVYNSWDMEATQMSIDRCIDKEAMVHIYKWNIAQPEKETQLSQFYRMRWMNLEPIIQSEESQKEKDKYRILTHICKIQKNGTNNLFAGQQWGCRHREQICGQQGEEEGGKNGESSMKTYILPYVKQPVGICYMTLETQSRAL